MSSATSAIRATVGRISRGTATFGTRSRAILATCTDRSPIRSSSLTMRSAATTVRRSPATGCCRESSENAFSSTALPCAVDVDVRADHLLGDLGVAGQQRLGGESYGFLDAAADAGKVVEDGIELFMEGLTHGGDPRRVE